jgi:hypothetical protein
MRFQIASFRGGSSKQVNVIGSAAVASGIAPVRLVHSAVPGRARFEVAGLYRDQGFAQILEGQLRRRSGVVSASASPLTGKALVLFDPKLDLKQVRTWVDDAAAVAGRWSHTAGKANNGGDGSISSFSLSGEDGPIWYCQPPQKVASLLDTSPRPVFARQWQLSGSSVSARIACPALSHALGSRFSRSSSTISRSHCWASPRRFHC